MDTFSTKVAIDFMSTEALTNEDSGTLTNAFNSYSAIRNNNTGIGTSRDKTSSTYIESPHLIAEGERIALFRSSNIVRKIITLYPEDAARGWFEPTFGDSKIEPSELLDYFENFKTIGLRQAFLEASIEARLHGNSWLLLGVDDGQSFDKPLDEKRIKSFRWIEILYHDEVTPAELNFRREAETYWVHLSMRSLEQTEETISTTVHRSRLIKFSGDKLYSAAHLYNVHKDDSVLQNMLSAYLAFVNGLMASSSMLSDYSVFTYKLKGLAKLIQQGESDKILQRFLTIQMGLSSIKGLIMDSENEEANFMNRSFGGAKDILDQLMEVMIAETDVPRFKLLGSNGKAGAETKGTHERYEWASLVNSWQVDNWHQPLKYLCRLALLSKDGITKGSLPKSYDIHFHNILQLSPLEEQDLRLKKAEENKINIELKIYTPYEARISGYGSPKWSSEITLDPAITERLKKEALNPPEEKPVDDTPIKQNIDYNEDRSEVLSDTEFDELSKVNVLEIIEGIVDV